MLSLRTWYRLLTQRHLLGVGGESGKHSGWTHQGGCRAVGAREMGEGGKGDALSWFPLIQIAGRWTNAVSSEAALSCHGSLGCLLPPLLPGSCSTIKVRIAHLKCEMRAQWEEVACSFVPWCMKRPNKMQMDWRRPCGLVATMGSEECEQNPWQHQHCRFAVGLKPVCRWGEKLFFMTLPSDQLPLHPSWKKQQVRPVERGGQKSAFLGNWRKSEVLSPPSACW